MWERNILKRKSNCCEFYLFSKVGRIILGLINVKFCSVLVVLKFLFLWNIVNMIVGLRYLINVVSFVFVNLVFCGMGVI